MKITSEKGPVVVTNSYVDSTLLALFYQRAFFENEFWIVKLRGLYRCFCPPSENYFCAHALSRGTKKSRIHVCSNLEQNMRSRTQNSQRAQCTTFHLCREEFSIGRKHIFKSALFFNSRLFFNSCKDSPRSLLHCGRYSHSCPPLSSTRPNSGFLSQKYSWRY